LLADGANPNLSCCDDTPIGEAAGGGHVDVARMLLAAGAKPRNGWPLGMAARRGDRELVLMLLEAGAQGSDKGTTAKTRSRSRARKATKTSPV
jgi:ankyrin repeat protein